MDKLGVIKVKDMKNGDATLMAVNSQHERWRGDAHVMRDIVLI